LLLLAEYSSERSWIFSVLSKTGAHALSFSLKFTERIFWDSNLNYGGVKVRSPGFEPGIISLEGSRPILDWRRDVQEFKEYLDSKHYEKDYRKTLLRQLELFVGVIKEPMDLVRAAINLTDGQKHNLNRALSALLRFYELKGVNQNYLSALRKAVPKDPDFIDLYVPSEAEVIEALKKLNGFPTKYRAFYNLALDSGLRMTEVARLINEFENAIEVNGFYRCTLGYFRGCKLAFAGYFTPYTLALIQQVKKAKEQVGDNCASHYFYKYRLLSVKYLRKFAFDTMISERLNVPESVADFIEGRTPKKIGARHYSKLIAQADGHYPKYANYIAELRKNALR
jgi:intergrase/recombinase